ncbi:MAG TPA: signal peptidase II [Caulobacteraceae bacterium]|jgi:signal peptidase II
MRRISRLALVAYALALAVVVADQSLKYWLLTYFHLPDRVTTPLIGPLSLTMVWNHGVSFGVFNSDAEWTRWALTAFSAGVAAILAVWAARTEQAILAVALGLIMGGALGNMIDRVRLGAVADFINFGHWFPWVFNVADAAINVGSALLIWDLFLAPRKRAGA